ncbi:hypothetical protein ACXR0O_23695 [Verrucomicrobiota bacterium sgz303538]
MRKRPDARALLYERIRTAPPKFVHVTGVPYTVEVEACDDPEKLDHVWMTMEVPPLGRIRASINTVSRAGRQAGVDSRIFVAVLPNTWTEKPQTGLVECDGQSYAKVEAATEISYTPYDREELTAILLTKMKAAIRAEVWGDLYARDHLGVHQIHSRRASAAVSTDVKNRDGALKLYYAQDNLAELFLFKFAGQP